MWAKKKAIQVDVQTKAVRDLVSQMNERRPLPVSYLELKPWFDRIISGACIPNSEDPILRRSLEWVLCAMATQLGQTEDHKEDAFFIHGVRKAASNQIFVARQEEIREEKAKEKQAQMEAELKARADKVNAETSETARS